MTAKSDTIKSPNWIMRVSVRAILIGPTSFPQHVRAGDVPSSSVLIPSLAQLRRPPRESLAVPTKPTRWIFATVLERLFYKIPLPLDQRGRMFPRSDAEVLYPFLLAELEKRGIPVKVYV
jgi:hypothetical protein